MILLLFDNDANKQPAQFGDIYIRCLPTQSNNTIIEVGIENLLPADSIPDEMFDVVEKKKPAGGKTVSTTLNKMKLCRFICDERRQPSDFELFSGVLDEIAAIFAIDCHDRSTETQGANSIA